MSKNKILHITMTRQETVYGLIYLGLQLLVIPDLLQIGNLLLGEPLSSAELNCLFFLINFLAVLWIFRRFLKASLSLAKSRMGWTLHSALLGFFLYQITTNLLSLAIMAVYPGFANVNDSSIASMTAENYSLMAIGTVFLVPVAEELLYRGVLFQGLYSKSRWGAYIVSALVFSAIHVVGYIGSFEPALLLACFLQYLPAGIFLGWAYVRADTIVAPILIHMTVNAMGIYAVR